MLAEDSKCSSYQISSNHDIKVSNLNQDFSNSSIDKWMDRSIMRFNSENDSIDEDIYQKISSTQLEESLQIIDKRV